MPPAQTTPAQTNTANQKTPTGSPSKKKTRRGRGRGKDRDRGESKEGSPVPVINGTLVSNTTGNAAPNDTVTVVTGQQEAQINDKAQDELSETSPSPNNGLLTDANAFSELNMSLTSALMERETRLNSKEELAELALRLLQTDKNFVDALWRAWKSSQEKSAEILKDNIIQATMSLTPAAEASTIASVEHGHFALTKSAPATLPTLADGTGSALSDPAISPASLHSDPLSESIITVKDTMGIETERERSTSIGQSKTQEFWDEEESHVVESLL
ncbi:hypothetical protein F5050DRAFT_1340346 [Lentinula boryana]|uniref:Uncharacterized protein n=1 Tax=Lentinula boryana TaxID=40481 RepID=A0ABQ8QHD2_9AGAR|nr:hypothetical protein F5050DRAFT_1340346 [Lentinula boryana]